MTFVEKHLVHATTISLNGSAVMIRGESGAGKSDIALQLLESSGNGLVGMIIHAHLIADDQTQLERRGDKIYASAPATIRGLIEVRGQGILPVATVDNVVLALVVDLKPEHDIERLPGEDTLSTELLGLPIARVSIDPSKPSAAARVRVAWGRLQKL